MGRFVLKGCWGAWACLWALIVCRIRDRNHELRLVLQEEERKALEDFQGAVQEAEQRIMKQVRSCLIIHAGRWRESRIGRGRADVVSSTVSASAGT